MSALLNRFGDYLLEKALASECKQAGLISTSIELSFGSVEYLRSKISAEDPSEAIVMLHGASADKTSWPRFTKHLNSKLLVVIPDLPGHGDSIAAMDLCYDINAQAERLKELLTKLGIERVHLIGNSMGGTIAVHLASVSPNLVASLILIGAAGFEACPSWLRQHFAATGINPMIELKDASDYRTMMGIGMQSPPYIPQILVAALTRAFVKREAINQKIVNDIEKDLNQTDCLANIVAPVLIIWGAADKVEHVANAELLHQRLGNSKKIIMEGIGHVPMIEDPKRVASACSAFYQTM
jgi:abhydrolase domain-containing protein 6